ncbi:uncharacterized protein KY384_007700 [Bacidia gigantensis]|uniref:uncharacterized protein n=1 Tax=Bacidia gigantensis TaxID=2732470 RepID=UPI001D04ED04|nr:uncharacterized protein KY384_007700 [Bacidia gigantensis]KAG8527548.1 hypothetical protein KY384_007700 [Bacidia gigantensis]
MPSKLTPDQLDAMKITERVTSLLSMLSVLFIVFTFLLARGFDKPINRLVFFASFSNVGVNIATFIAEDGPAAGPKSALCQFQAWAIQMFLGVDVFWALCMALNVYLALFCAWTAQRLRAQEWKYFLGCYGAAFVPSLIYIFVETEGRGKIYGPATLWCWITPEWDFLRVLTLYAIVWIALVSAFAIYCKAAKKVWHNREKLSGLLNPFNEDPFSTTITTEIEVTYEPARPSISHTSSHHSDFKRRMESQLPPMPGTEDDHREEAPDLYRANIEAGRLENDRSRRPSRPKLHGARSYTREAALRELNPDAWLYARAAFLFFCAMLIPWIPASINRLYSLVHPNRIIFGLNYAQSLVLPLQGFLNCCVYIITSQTAVMNLFRSMIGKPEIPRRSDYVSANGLNAASGDKDAKNLPVKMGHLAAGLTNHGSSAGGKLGKFVGRKASLQRPQEGRQRLGSDGSNSMPMFAEVHHTPKR